MFNSVCTDHHASRDKNEGTYRSGEGAGGPAV